jgi:hypothetical protein
MIDSLSLYEKIKLSKPIIILGNNRSGTSLLRLMLHSHSQICIPPESHFFLWLEERYKNWNSNKLNTYVEDLFNATKFETWNINKENLLTFLKGHTITNYAELTSLVYKFYAVKHLKNDTIYWGDKNSLWVDKLGTILEHFPNALFIHLIRDGRDVACSYKTLKSMRIESKYAPKLPTDIEAIAEIWKNNVSSVDDFLMFKVKESNKITLLYENLLKEPDYYLSLILSKISLHLEKSQLNYYKQSSEKIEPKAFLAWKEKLQEPIDLSNIGKFKRELTFNEIELFNKCAGAVLKKFNYL